MLHNFEAAELGSANALLAVYDARTQAAIDTFLGTLPDNAQVNATRVIEDGHRSVANMWERLQLGAAPHGSDRGGDQEDEVAAFALRQLGSRAAGLVADAGSEDEEHPFAARARGPQVQRLLSRLVDEVATQGIREHYEEANSSFDIARLDDLSHPETDHSWIWGMCSHHGAIVEDYDEYIEALRVRLGSADLPEGGICSACGERLLDRSGAHATCCAQGESTRGHNALRDVVFKFALWGFCCGKRNAASDPITPTRPSC
jgi:hypothetical protein